MNVQSRIETITEKHLIGKRLLMSFAQNKTFELWSSFMPKRKGIDNAVGPELYSVEVYPPSFFEPYDPSAEFEKWAAVEVSNLENIPQGLETLVIPPGRYAVFVHKGPASEGHKTYEAIFKDWLPASAYRLDQRPHFAVMGETYRRDDPDSEEEIWIPVEAN